MTNTLECNYDEGACCLPEIKDAYCVECICNTDGTRHPTVVIQECPQPTWTGDGLCDDNTNIEACNFDEGDCCLPEIIDDNCFDCFCYNDSSRHPSVVQNSTCHSPDYQGDGYCDDANNVLACDYDLGDCCGGNIMYCTECLCHNATSSGNSTESTTCLETLKGDDYCDDSNNILECDYDYGDCCLSPVQTTYCETCLCHETGLVHTTVASTTVGV